MDAAASRPATRVIGALSAALLSIPVALMLLLTSAPDDERGLALGLAGFPVSAGVGWILAPRALATQGRGFGTAIGFAFMAVLVGGLVWGLLFAVLGGHDPEAALSFAIIGWLFLGIPMLILGVNLALLWIAVPRRGIRPTHGESPKR